MVLLKVLLFEMANLIQGENPKSATILLKALFYKH
jgi:hypothetical protein